MGDRSQQNKPLYLVVGKGRMGRSLLSLLEKKEDIILCCVDSSKELKEIFLENNVTLCFDFTSREAFLENLPLYREVKIPLVCGTTGFLSEELFAWKEAFTKEKFPFIYSANFSFAVQYLRQLYKEIVPFVEKVGMESHLIEIHQKEKKDAPSGTAHLLGKDLHLPITSIRVGSYMPEHRLICSGQGEVIELLHRAEDRVIYAEGALKAGAWLLEQEPKCYFFEECFQTIASGSTTCVK